jgi:hypothetical protein
MAPVTVSAATLQDSTETHWAENLQKAVARLPEQAYSAVVIDQFLRENEPAESDQLLEHLGTAFPLLPQLRNSWQGAVGAQSRSALHRRKREETQARRAVKQPFRSEMYESLTSMLLSCELAMSVPGVPGPAAEKIGAFEDLAREMCLRAN